MGSEKKKIMDMIAEGEYENALKEPSVLDVLKYTGIDVVDL